MRILVYRERNVPRLGVAIGGKVHNAECIVRDYASSRGLPREYALIANPWLFYKHGFEAVRVLEKAIDAGFTCPADVDIDKDVLVPPVLNPSKIIGIGLNYIDHIEETRAKIPTEPVIFLKAPSSLVGHNDNIVIPQGLEKVDYEVELVLVIGNTVKNVSGREAAEAILGLSIGNDVTARSLQIDRGLPWSWAKSYDTFSPLGPVIVTCDELGGCGEPDLAIRLKLNNEVMQDSRTNNMVFSPRQLVESISRVMTLNPGDLIYTGTPGGVGFMRKPPVFLKSGDVIESYVEEIGVLRNNVISEV